MEILPVLAVSFGTFSGSVIFTIAEIFVLKMPKSGKFNYSGSVF